MKKLLVLCALLLTLCIPVSNNSFLASDVEIGPPHSDEDSTTL